MPDFAATSPDLTEHVDLAVASIQRLTPENHRLRRERDDASRVTPITQAHRRRPY